MTIPVGRAQFLVQAQLPPCSAHRLLSSWVGASMANRLRPFVVDRNIRHFLWYGGVAGEGLRSDAVDVLPLSRSVCSILPIARHFRAGVLRGSGLYTAVGRSVLLSPFARPVLC